MGWNGVRKPTCLTVTWCHGRGGSQVGRKVNEPLMFNHLWEHGEKLLQGYTEVMRLWLSWDSGRWPCEVTRENQPKFLWLEIWLRLEIPYNEVIFFHTLKLTSHSSLSCCRRVKDSQEKKRGTFVLPATTYTQTPTLSSHIAAFRSDWSPDRPRIRAM